MKKCCGNCKWHQKEAFGNGFVCVNGKSDKCTDWTDDEDGCADFEPTIRIRIAEYITMIDEYTEEPHNIDQKWVECLTFCKKLLTKELRNNESK